jgi:hypothetical protein
LDASVIVGGIENGAPGGYSGCLLVESLDEVNPESLFPNAACAARENAGKKAVKN